MVGVMHDLVIIAREQHQKANDTAKKLVQIFGLENRPMGQFMLGGIEKIDRHTKTKSGG